VPRGADAARDEHSAEAGNESTSQQHGRLPDLVVDAKLLKFPGAVHADRAGLVRADLAPADSNHKHYMTARLICVNDIYSFDPNAKVSLDDFTDIIGRNFKQPKEGLGLDNSPSAHMWRTMLWPSRFL
jgi:predicted AlkP superfamily phosphohydrolase/phosphomutase